MNAAVEMKSVWKTATTLRTQGVNAEQAKATPYNCHMQPADNNIVES